MSEIKGEKKEEKKVGICSKAQPVDDMDGC